MYIHTRDLKITELLNSRGLEESFIFVGEASTQRNKYSCIFFSWKIYFIKLLLRHNPIPELVTFPHVFFLLISQLVRYLTSLFFSNYWDVSVCIVQWYIWGNDMNASARLGMWVLEQTSETELGKVRGEYVCGLEQHWEFCMRQTES